tara:strand:+ start:3838 stop:4080 length:243 start_codon:yes stop_codon:yes gene_type:complete
MMNVVQAKEVDGRDKPVWLKHGVAFEKDGKISIKLESLPLPNKDGEVWLRLFEQDDSRRGSVNGQLGSSERGDTADEIPF